MLSCEFHPCDTSPNADRFTVHKEYTAMGERRQYNADDVLELQDVADYLRITYQRAGRLLRSGEIRGRQIGPYWRVPFQNVRDYLDPTDVKKSA